MMGFPEWRSIAKAWYLGLRKLNVKASWARADNATLEKPLLGNCADKPC